MGIMVGGDWDYETWFDKIWVPKETQTHKK